MVADQLPVAIWLGGVPGGETIYSNAAFREVLGIDRPPDAGRGAFVAPYGVHTLTGERYPEDRMPYEQVLAARASVVIDDLVIHRHDGRKVNLRVIAKPIFDDAGNLTHVLEAFHDITREVEAERARIDSERRLALSQRLESIGRLVAGIAHDFNNLLTVTKLVVAGLEATEKDSRRRDALAQIDTVTDSAVRLIKNLLHFARRGEHRTAPVSLETVVTAIVEIASRTIDRRITLTTDLGTDGAVIRGDRAQLEQVVMNLLLNARDAISGPGEVTVRTRLRHLPAGPHVVLEVCDSGSGIDPAIRDRIFEPYFTTKTWGPIKGTGLGLATVHGIVHTHGGFVEVDDNPPRGTTLRVVLPCHDGGEVAADTGEHAALTGPPGDAARNGGLILVVDDEPLVRQSTAMTLRGLGYRVLEAGDGPAALEAFASHRDEISAVLLDMVLPGQSGKDVYVAMRKVRPDVAVIVITGTVLGDDIREMHQLGVASALSKPYDAAQLAASLRQLGRA